MSQTITYTCDRCGRSKDDDYAFLKRVAVGVGSELDRFGHQFIKEGRRAEWCKDCIVELGIWEPRVETDPEPIEPKPTLEDLIREIVQEEIDNA